MGKVKKEISIDRRSASGRRDGAERRKESVRVAVERRAVPERRNKVARRRQIDPTTCERDYSGEEIEFMQALDAYKRANGRMFPTCSEILEVIRGLGYVRISPTIVAVPENPLEAPESQELSSSNRTQDDS